MNKIVSVEWLSQNLDKPNLIVLDASVNSSINPIDDQFLDVRIPKARKFDLKTVFVNKNSAFPNTIPNPEHFEEECRKLGIHQDSEIVVYDHHGVYSSPRVWWLFQVMGHQNVAVLNGGLPEWIKHDLQTTNKVTEDYEEGNFTVNFNKDLVINFEQIKENITNQNFLVIDARSKGRFTGAAPEPRKELQSGSIQNSVNIPFKDVLYNGKFKTEEELKNIFNQTCKSDNELVFSCGSGMTACIIMLASQLAYQDSKKVYDGSWTEWAELNNLKTVL